MSLIKCPECQKELSSTVKTCIHCGFNLSQEEKTHDQETKKKSHSGLGVLLISIFLVVGWVFYHSHNNDTPKKTISGSSNAALIHNWLSALKAGGDGGRYWSSSSATTKLYSVRNWKILSESPKETMWVDNKPVRGNHVKVRVDSSNKGGMQITKIWVVGIVKNRIVSIEEN